MNMLIAKTHRFASQLAGLQMSIANVVAIVLSAFSIVAGLVSLAIIALPGQYVYYVIFGVAGLLLAWLIESLTVSNLRKLRTVNVGLDKLEVAEVQRGHELSDQGKQLLERQKKKLKTARVIAVVFVIFGVIVSAIGGGLFWHVVLEALPLVLNIVISTLFAVIVSATFVCTEMHREINLAAVAESISSGDLVKLAHKEDTAADTLDRLRAEEQKQLEDEKAVRSIESGAARHTASIVRSVITEDDELTPDEEMEAYIEATFTPQKALPPPRRRDKQHNLTVIGELVERYGEIYVRGHINEIATTNGISRATVYNYLKKLTS
jgi:hypothetical protein